MFVNFKVTLETIEVVYLNSSKLRWALGLTAFGPWIFVAAGYLLTITTDRSAYAALSNAVTNGVRQFLPFLGVATLIMFSLRAAAIFRQEKQRLYGLQ